MTTQGDGRARRSAWSSTIRSPSAANFASRSPTTTVTGIVSSPSRSHSGAISPVPMPRTPPRAPRGDCDAGRRARAIATAGGSSANSGCVRQRSTKSSNRLIVPDRSARRSSERRRVGALGVVLDARAGRRRARAAVTRSGAAARRAAPRVRPASSRAARSARGRREHMLDARAKVIGRGASRLAMPRQVERQRPVAFRIEQLDTPSHARRVPPKPCSRTTFSGNPLSDTRAS